jgi:hypothetical protein
VNVSPVRARPLLSAPLAVGLDRSSQATGGFLHLLRFAYQTPSVLHELDHDVRRITREH